MGILSDVHDHLANLGAAIEYLNTQPVEAAICCGDLCSPFVVDELKKFQGPLHIVFGNNDADLYRITRKCDTRVQAHGESLEIELGGRKSAIGEHIERRRQNLGGPCILASLPARLVHRRFRIK